MRDQSRKLIDRSFSGLGIFSIVVLAAGLLILLAPIFIRGWGAFYFKGTIEYRKVMLDKFGRGNREAVAAETAQADKERQLVYDMLDAFKKELRTFDRSRRRELRSSLKELNAAIDELLGPRPGKKKKALMRKRYGPTRWDRAQVKLDQLLKVEQYDYSDSTRMGKKYYVLRAAEFAGTSLEPLFGYVEDNLAGMLRPRRTFYWRFLFDQSYDAHFFGGIWPEILGTIYLTVGAMLFAVPMGVISAIYLVEYARQNRFVSLLRTCISTLAGVPSIVFGLFGLAFFINTVGVSSSKSVLAGSLTLALLVLPIIIRTAEEAIRSVPITYKEASLSLGAGKWWTIVTVILPAALPGILTGIVISMGRAAGETAPIIFTAAVSVGKPLTLWQTFSEPTPALPWNIYNLATEHAAVDEISHVQYGMVMVLIILVLLLNVTALILRARIARKLKG